MVGAERRRWVIISGLFVILVVLFGGGILAFGVFFEPLRTTFNWSHAQTASLLTVLLLVLTVTSPIVGWLLNRLAAQTAILIGAILMVVADVLASGAHAFGPMVAAFALLGVGLAFSTLVPVQVVVASWFQTRLQGTAFGIAAAGTAAGGCFMVLGADAAVDLWGWRAALLAMAAPIVVIVIPLVLFVIRVSPAGQAGHAGDAASLDVGDGFRSGSVWLILAAYMCYGLAVGIPVAHLVPFLIKTGYTPHTAAMVVVWYQGVGTLGSLLMGVFGDRLGGKSVLAVCFVIMAISLLVLLDVGSLAMRIVFIVLFGFAVASPTALLALLLAQAVGLKSFGFFSGAGQFLLMLGFAVSPFVGGWIIDLTASYSDAFGLSAVIALVAAVTSLALSIPGALPGSGVAVSKDSA